LLFSAKSGYGFFIDTDQFNGHSVDHLQAEEQDSFRGGIVLHIQVFSHSFLRLTDPPHSSKKSIRPTGGLSHNQIAAPNHPDILQQ
jgi:hypothetical protein